MSGFNRWADRMVRRACEWLNGLLPGGHALAAAGYRMAGLRREVHLPVDRRLGSNVLLHGQGTDTKSHKGDAKAGTSSLETDCGFWAYCHISGQPCQRCNVTPLVTINSLLPGTAWDLTQLCGFVGKESGSMWMGCCINPQGQMRLIGFADCCSPGGLDMPQDCGNPPWCENWPEAKNWCWVNGGRTTTYYCTVVVDAGNCNS